MRRNKILLSLTLQAILLTSFLSFDVKLAQAASASLYLAPASGTHVINGKFNVAVKLNSGGVEVNAAEGTISYDTGLVEVVGVSKGGSIFPFWTAEPSFNNSSGVISFGGGMPPPAYNGSAGHICTVTFRTKKAGTASVRFTSGAVLANDGKGTNVLASMGSGSYVISPKVDAPPSATNNTKPQEPPKRAEPDYNLPEIKSSTHPDPNAWYNKKDVEFSWDLPDGVSGVSIAFDNDPTTDPGPKSDGLFDSKSYEGVEDGMHYLHLKFKDSRRWGTIAHYRVMIDSTPPETFDAEIKRIGVGEWPELLFETKDKLSGLEKYEVNIGSLEKQAHEIKPEETGLKISDLSVGEHTALIRAIDKAGNERVVTVNFTIDPIDSPVIVNYPSTLKATDNFFVNGTAPIDSEIIVYIEDSKGSTAESTVRSDANGNWFFVNDTGMSNGRYIAWAVAKNQNGIKSNPSQKVSFLVSAPVFAVVGSFVINYFTVFVSLLFMVVLIVLIIIYIIGFVRKRLKKETLEVEEVLENNASAMQKAIEDEFASLEKYEGKKIYKIEKAKTKKRLQAKVEENKRRSLKEIRDVENLLK